MFGWTWFRTRAKAPIDSNPTYNWARIPLYGRFADGFTVFGPYRRPIMSATGRGTLYHRQLKPLSPNVVIPQSWTPVGIAGNGSELSGVFSSMGLVDVTSNSNQTTV